MKDIAKYIVMSNQEIYNIYNKYYTAFIQSEFYKDNYLPAKIAYKISVTIKELEKYSTLIEDSRLKIFDHYGKFDATENKYRFDKEIVAKVNTELDDLLSINQRIKIYIIDMEEIKDINFTIDLLNALSFMINLDAEIKDGSELEIKVTLS